MSLEQTEAWNFYFADDAPEKKETTRRFSDKVKQGEYEVFIFDAVMGEIDKAGDRKKKSLLTLIKKWEPQCLIINEEILRLARMYVSDGIFPVNKIEVAIHAAAATVFEMDALISWNLKHLSNLRKMEMINGINMKEGYAKRLELITPMEVSDEEL